MWVARNRSWFVTLVLDGAALPRIWKRTLLVTMLSVVVTILYHKIPLFHHSITDRPFALIGLPLGVFLGFRNNAAYERFWEGRRQWGALVNTSRSLTRQILTMLEASDAAQSEALAAFQRRFLRMLIGYAHALRHHLRDTDPTAMLESVLPAGERERLEGEVNTPVALLHRMGEMMAEARRNDWMSVHHATIFEQSLVSITDIQGACERIKSTPIPYSYTVLMHRIVAGYCALLPFGLDETIGWATPLVVLGISYAFFGLDAIGWEIEQPFGVDPNDLALGAISTTIERDLRRRLGDPLPPPAAPDKCVLV